MPGSPCPLKLSLIPSQPQRYEQNITGSTPRLFVVVLAYHDDPTKCATLAAANASGHDLAVTAPSPSDSVADTTNVDGSLGGQGRAFSCWSAVTGGSKAEGGSCRENLRLWVLV